MSFLYRANTDSLIQNDHDFVNYLPKDNALGTHIFSYKYGYTQNFLRNQVKSVLQYTDIKDSFLLSFPHELLMSFVNIYIP